MTPFRGEWLVVHAGDGDPPRVMCQAGAPEPWRAAGDDGLVVFDGVLYGPGADDPAAHVLDGLRREGPRSLAGLRGRFSLVAWTRDGDVLHALRDPLGVRPMFHARAGAAHAVSPYAEALVRQPGVDRSIDPLFVAGAMILGLVAKPEETPFAGVRRIPAGSVLSARGGRVEVRRHWRPVPRPVTARERGETFARLLEQAVERCTGGRRSAVMLSGGLDSATLAASLTRLARRDGQAPPYALSYLNPTPDADEEPMQRRVAQVLGMRHIACRPEELIAPGEQVRATLELGAGRAFPTGLIQPSFNLMIRRAASDGVSSVLLGDGGDEWLMPQSAWATNRILRLDVRALRLMLRAWTYAYPEGETPHLARDVLWRWGLRSLLRGGVARLGARFAPARHRRIRGRRLEARLPDYLVPDPAMRARLLDWAIERSPEPPLTRLHEAERDQILRGANTAIAMEDAVANGRHLGIEILRPFWDVDLIEFLLGLPGDALIAGGRAKALARDYLVNDLPFAERWPAKTYGDSVIAEIMEREGDAAWAACGGGRSLTDLGVFDNGHEQMDRQRTQKYPATAPVSRIWAVVATESWLRSVHF
jgi:asparagine synthase (glutamine-hydrolysing)